MERIGIIQGRLAPPEDHRIQCFPRVGWADEFARAAEAGLGCIEWIFDVYGEDVDPLGTDAGIEQIKMLAARDGVPILSICADYFMDRPLLRTDAGELEDRLQKLQWLVRRGGLLGVKRVVLPFVDASAIRDDAELRQVATLLRRLAPVAEETELELHLETALGPTRFSELLGSVPHPLVKVNYDSGNSASLSYDPREEFAAYGDRVGSVHIKDRLRGGGTVPLGTGDADLSALFECLQNVDYSGELILQVARGVPGDEIAWARRNRDFVLERWQPTR